MIKKIIQLNPTGTTGTTNVFYSFSILLTSQEQDLGFFDTYSGFTGSTGITGTPYTVTGTSTSRLSELSKYVVTTAPWDKYILSSSPSTDGLNLAQSNTGGTAGFVIYTYYLGGITYVDSTPTGTTATTTTFSFQTLGYADPNNFDNLPIIKLESKQNMAENPFVNPDVNIVRQDIPVFEDAMRLRAVNKLSDVTSYAGGGFFTVYNNS